MINRIISEYTGGKSCIQIAESINLSTKAIQRIIAKAGIMRSKSETFKLAIQSGRMKYTKGIKAPRKRLQDKVRYQVFLNCGNKCNICGNTAEHARIQIDHIDNNHNNNALDNLQILCELCNRGKYYNSI